MNRTVCGNIGLVRRRQHGNRAAHAYCPSRKQRDGFLGEPVGLD